MIVCLVCRTLMCLMFCLNSRGQSYCSRRQTPVIMVPSSVLTRPFGFGGCVLYTRLKLLARKEALVTCVFLAFFFNCSFSGNTPTSPTAFSVFCCSCRGRSSFPFSPALLKGANSCPQGGLPSGCPAAALQPGLFHHLGSSETLGLRIARVYRKGNAGKTRQPINTIQPLNIQ